MSEVSVTRPPAGTTIPATLDGLIEWRRIEDVMFEYCDAADEMRIDDLMAIFTPECRYDIGFGSVLHGHAEVRAWFLDRLPKAIFTSHHVSDVRIRLTGEDRAEATSFVYARSTRVDFHSELWGRYQDVFVKRDGVWLIDERRLRASGFEQTVLPPREGHGQFELIERGTAA